MKKILLLTTIPMIACSAFGSEADDVKAAAKKLGNNYSWHTTVAVPEGGQSRFRAGPTDGKTDESGNIWLSMTRGENTTQAVLKGDKGAAKVEGEWRSLADLSQDGGGQPGPGSFVARMLRNYKAPATEAGDLAAKTKSLKKEGDVYAGDLTEEGAKELLSFRGGRSGGQGAAAPTNAKGSAKFWIKDGQLSKYEYKVSGTVNAGGQDRDIDRTTTVEIKDVGSSKVEVPEDAKKKLS